MPSTTPIVRQASWRVALPSLFILTGVVALGWTLGGQVGMFVAIACYLAYSIAARFVIARDHRVGIELTRRESFREAIPHFERSFDFFDRHRWLDDWRGFVMLSSSRASYREIALLNGAFCHSQVGEGLQAEATYRRCLELYPSSGMAEAGLRLIEAARSGV
jgi:hypothetical protein